MTHVRMDRMHEGVKVFGEQLISHLDRQGQVKDLTGEVSTMPAGLGSAPVKLSAKDALAIVSVVSTVGAGDTLVAGMLHGVLSGWPRERGLRFATALAAESVHHIGVGDPGASDFEQLQQRTHVRSLSVDALPHRLLP